MISPLALPHRYLVGFDPRDLPHHFTDVLVIGGGLAGLRAALGVREPLRVLVVTKDEVRESNSNYAQGGIAGVLDPEDRFDDHIADTLAAGKGLCDPEVVAMVVREAPERIAELIAMGHPVRRGERPRRPRPRRGPLARADRPRPGRRHGPRGDARGDRAGARRGRTCGSGRTASRSICSTHEGRCRGALVWDRARGPSLVWARATVLATGGAGQLYRETTNPPSPPADGHALAYRAGAELRDMEFMQFHPTVLYIAGSSRHLLTEALRGEGAYLRDRNGDRFMPDYHPLAELAPRDDVSRAITAQMAKTQHPCVYLDLSHLDAAYLRAAVPGHRPALPRVRPRHHPRPDPGPPGCPLHDRRRRPSTSTAGRPCLASGPRARSPAPACTGRIGWPRTASSKASSTVRRAAEDLAGTLDADGPPRLEVPPIARFARIRWPRAARPGRHPRLASSPDVAARRHHPRRAGPDRGRRASRPLVPLRSRPGVRRPPAAGPSRTCSPSPA